MSPDGFMLQPYPLECSADGEHWSLVIAWRQQPGTAELVPLTATEAGLTTPIDGGLRYRLPPSERRGPAAIPPVAASPKTRPSTGREGA